MVRCVVPALFGVLLALPLWAQREAKPVDNTTRETTEWVNMRWERANDTKLPRVLLMGDSVTNQYHGEVNARLKDRANVDLLATSKSICDPALLREVRAMVTDYKYAVIHFNNGLHGFHLSPAEYEAGLRRLVALLRELQPQAKLIWGQCTPIVSTDDPAVLGGGNSVVLVRNEVASRVMAELGIPVDDLYAVSVGHPEYRNRGDGYHFSQAGKVAQAEVVAKMVSEALQ